MNKKKPVEVENSDNGSVNNFFLVKKLKKQLEEANERIKNLRERSFRKDDRIANLLEELKTIRGKGQRSTYKGPEYRTVDSSNHFYIANCKGYKEMNLMEVASTWDTGD